jgi:peptidoglycan hydrolase CwlO-like protein
MFKKVWIAALAVVVGLVTLGVVSPKLAGVARLKWRNIVQKAERQVTPETEIELINQKLDQLANEDRRFVDQIVRYGLKTEKMQKQVGDKRTALTRLDGEVREMFVSLKTEGERVAYRGDNYPRSEMQRQVRMDAERLQRLEASLKADEAQLKELNETRNLYEKRLADLRAERESMRTEVQRIQNALLQERLAQEKGRVASDDGGLSNVRRDMDSLSERVKVMQKTRELQGSSDDGPVRRAQAEKQREAGIDNFLQNRYAAPVQAPVASAPGATNR